MHASKIKVRLENLDAGWVDVDVHVDAQSFRMDGVTYIHDGLMELLTSGLGAIRGQPQMAVRLMQEPGFWRLDITKSVLKPEHLRLAIYDLTDQKTEPAELPPPVFVCECGAGSYARAVRNAFAAWKNKPADFEARWYRPFPHHEFNTLDDALT